MKMKKILALLLVCSMVFAMVACGDKDDKKDDNTPTQAVEPTSPVAHAEKRTINIGTWFEQYYTSAHQTVDANPNVNNLDEAQMMLDNMRAIEHRYNVELYFKNLTWNGVIESINTSIMAGSPNCEVYQVDLQFGLPAVLAGYAEGLEDFLTEEEMNNESFQGLKLPGSDKTYLFYGKATNTNGYPLGYNKALIEAANLEDPYELYLRGEWTWSKWMEYMEKLTNTSAGQYGYRGAWTNTFTQLLFSNGASVASPSPNEDGKVVEGLSSQATTNVLNFMKEIYVDKGVSFWNADCDSDWDSNVYAFGKGNIAFFPAACWIIQSADPEHQIDLGIVPWPTGPDVAEGQKVASYNQTSGNFYMIPKGIDDPKQIYYVLRDYTAWYGDDLTLRDKTTWAEEWMAGSKNSETNFDVLCSMTDETSDFTIELWDQVKLSDDYNIRGLIDGSCEVAQVIETNKQLVQDYLDTNFGNQ